MDDAPLPLVVPVATAVFTWWLATGVVMLLDGLPRRTFRPTLAAASALAGAALAGLAWTRSDPSVAGAYAAFGCGIAVWAWQELSFLTGALTGPRRHGCPPGCGGWRHARHAVEAIAHHELAILAGAALIVAITWDQPNQTGTRTYLVLMVMRQSAKLNLHLGVRNTGADFLPEHLAYLATFFRRRPLNPLLPVSVLGGAAVCAAWVHALLQPGVAAGAAAGGLLAATLLALAVLEHLMLVVPLPVDLPWRWSLRARRAWARRTGEAPRPDLDRRTAVLPSVR